MRILCSNDDGIRSPGLTAVEEIARSISDDVWTVAPEQDQSGVSRAITLTRPLRIRKVAPQRYSVDGTPTDCVQLGVTHLLKDARPDLILSGVNNGPNLAEDVTVSGTVAVAFQGMTLGIPSIAFSQTRSDRHKVDWSVATTHGPDLVRKLLAAGWPKDVIINVNFPDRAPEAVEGVEIVQQGRREQLEIYAEERTDMRQGRYYWFGFRGQPHTPPEGTDLHAVQAGKIAVTPLHLNLTDEAAQDRLKAAF